MNQYNNSMNAGVNLIPEFLENEEMWTQRAIDTPDEVLDELSRLNRKHPADVAHEQQDFRPKTLADK
jgi:hypothetical protein